MSKTREPVETGPTLAPEEDEGTLETLALGAAVSTWFEVGAATEPTLSPSDLDPEASHSALHTVDPERYARGEELGRGGMGRILVADDLRLRRPVAIKEMLGDPRSAARMRFEREALITAQLQHPGIVTVQDAGLWPSGDAFFAMEMVRGQDFQKVIDTLETLEDRLERLPILIDVADALAYAHARGVIHRDLKPENVLVGAFGETIVIDWGIAKLLGEPNDAIPRDDPPATPDPDVDSAQLTRAGSVMGTPAYMAPEQAEGMPVDERADVYAIGAMLYHLLCGHPPYTGQTSMQILMQVLSAPPPPLREQVQGLPEALLTLVDRAMARDRQDRYRNAGALAEELRRYASGQLVTSHTYTLRELPHPGGRGTGGGALSLQVCVGALIFGRLVVEAHGAAVPPDGDGSGLALSGFGDDEVASFGRGIRRGTALVGGGSVGADHGAGILLELGSVVQIAEARDAFFALDGLGEEGDKQENLASVFGPVVEVFGDRAEDELFAEVALAVGVGLEEAEVIDDGEAG